MALAFSTSHANGIGPSLEAEALVVEAALGDTGVGGCSDQYLDGGELLPDLPLFYSRSHPAVSWGTPEMIDLLVETGRHMRWLLPEASPLVIGDIASRQGGFLSGHLSHRGGVDADVGIYRTGAWQRPNGFTALGPDFDAEANWALISAMLETGKVDFILLDQSHINRLERYVLQKGLLTEAELETVFPKHHYWERTGVVRHAPNHLDHLHVRVLCADGSRAL